MSLIETLISSFIISFVTVLAWLAYRHNHAFRKIYPWLYGSSILIFFCVLSFILGMSYGVNHNGKSNLIPLSAILFIIVNAYFGLLYYLPNLLKKDDNDDKPK